MKLLSEDYAAASEFQVRFKANLLAETVLLSNRSALIGDHLRFESSPNLAFPWRTPNFPPAKPLLFDRFSNVLSVRIKILLISSEY